MYIYSQIIYYVNPYVTHHLLLEITTVLEFLAAMILCLNVFLFGFSINSYLIKKKTHNNTMMDRLSQLVTQNNNNIQHFTKGAYAYAHIWANSRAIFTDQWHIWSFYLMVMELLHDLSASWQSYCVWHNCRLTPKHTSTFNKYILHCLLWPASCLSKPIEQNPNGGQEWETIGIISDAILKHVSVFEINKGLESAEFSKNVIQF